MGTFVHFLGTSLISNRTEIATITYRSGPEWDQRFGRQLREVESHKQELGPDRVPALCPDFLIETYLDHQVRPNPRNIYPYLQWAFLGRTILPEVRRKLSYLYLESHGSIRYDISRAQGSRP